MNEKTKNDNAAHLLEKVFLKQKKLET